MKGILRLFIFTLSVSAFCHPVIYKGGWVYQGSFMPQMTDMKVAYTFDPKFAVTANTQSFETKDDYRDYTLGLNFLAKRWLQHDSQGNLYFGVHSGQYKDLNDEGQVNHGFIMADWEDREDYVLFKSKYYWFDDREERDFLFRYGFAPFVGGMNQLQAWMIVQAYYYKEVSQEIMLTPMIRFFYKNVLWEIGSSTKGDSFLTLMVHY